MIPHSRVDMRTRCGFVSIEGKGSSSSRTPSQLYDVVLGQARIGSRAILPSGARVPGSLVREQSSAVTVSAEQSLGALGYAGNGCCAT
jgi:hypothetical protein